MLVSPRCVNTRREFRTYHYPQTRFGANPVEEPSKVDDHAMDALRYFFASRFPQVDWRFV
jgi:phage terminase large subunit